MPAGSQNSIEKDNSSPTSRLDPSMSSIVHKPLTVPELICPRLFPATGKYVPE